MNATGEPARLCLRPLQALPGMKTVYPLSDATITVGRHPSNSISIAVEAVSRFHARIERQGNRYVVIDLNSSNGTYLDRKRIENAPLQPGQTVAFGNVEFRCETSALHMAGADDSTWEARVEFVGSDRKQSDLIFQAPAGKREATPIERFIEAPVDRDTLAKAYRKLAALYQLGDILHTAPEEHQLLECFMNLVFEVVPADRGVILMREGPEGELHSRVSRSREVHGGDTPIAISRTIIDRCMEERVAILSQDAASDQRFKASESVLFHDIRSTMVVPLISQRSDILGILHLDTRESVHAFNDDDLSFVTSLANDLALFLDHRHMSEESQRNQEMAAIGEIITDLAHNIKNVLLLAEGGIKLMDRLIDSGDLERVRQTWALTQKTMGRISTMVKEMLEYSRTPQVRQIRCNLNLIVRETCESFKTQFENKGITVRVRLDRRIEDGLLDAPGLERCLVNLLVNACEAIDHGNGEITVTTQLRPSRDLVLTVEDNGAGIPAAKLPRIFYPMFSTKGGEGTGLGLALVKKWVTAVGATIRAYSTEGEGSRFVITFPRETASVATEMADFSPSEPEEKRDD